MSAIKSLKNIIFIILRVKKSDSFVFLSNVTASTSITGTDDTDNTKWIIPLNDINYPPLINTAVNDYYILTFYWGRNKLYLDSAPYKVESYKIFLSGDLTQEVKNYCIQRCSAHSKKCEDLSIYVNKIKFSIS